MSGHFLKEIEEGLQRGFARSLKEIQSLLKADNVSVMRVLADRARDVESLVVLDGDLVRFYRPRITCQICQATMEGLQLQWHQCRRCGRETCLDCRVALEQVRHPECPHCNGDFILLPASCEGCRLSVVQFSVLESHLGHCPNCGHRLVNAEGIVEIASKSTNSKLTEESNAVVLTRVERVERSYTSSRSSSRRRGRSSRSRTTVSRRASSQKQTVYMVTHYKSTSQFLEHYVFPLLSHRIKEFDPKQHVLKDEIKLERVHPVVIAWYDAFAEFFGAGRVIYRVDVKDELMVMEASTEKMPLSLTSIKKFIKDAPEEVIKPIPVTRSKIVPASRLSRVGLEREVRSRIRQRHRRTVRYRGANNREYKKTCELKNSDIYLHEPPKMVHVPTWRFRFQVSGEMGKWHEVFFTETKDGLKVLSESWKNSNKFCQSCQRLVASLFRCHECRLLRCESCASSMTVWGLIKWFCSQKCQQQFAQKFESASWFGKLRHTWLSNSFIMLYLIIILLIVVGIAWMGT